MIEATRRLAAIMSADVAGYSRLMGEDEGGTISALDECFPVIRRHFETYNSRLVPSSASPASGSCCEGSRAIVFLHKLFGRTLSCPISRFRTKFSVHRFAGVEV